MTNEICRHGVYPGYYLTFGTAALVTEAARKVERYEWGQQVQVIMECRRDV